MPSSLLEITPSPALFSKRFVIAPFKIESNLPLYFGEAFLELPPNTERKNLISSEGKCPQASRPTTADRRPDKAVSRNPAVECRGQRGIVTAFIVPHALMSRKKVTSVFTQKLLDGGGHRFGHFEHGEMAAGVESAYRKPRVRGGEGLLGGEIPLILKSITHT